MEELKRCPFCGGKAVFYVNTVSSRNLLRGYEFNIQCSKCRTTTPERCYQIEFKMNDSGEIEVVHDGRKDAIEAWNSRYKED